MSWGEAFGKESLEKGYQYYSDGQVKELSVLPGSVSAIVAGESVSVRLENDEAEGECSCQEAWCPHMAAALYASGAMDSPGRSLEEILGEVPAEDLRKFVLALAEDPYVEEEARKWFDEDYQGEMETSEDLEDIFLDLPLGEDLSAEDLSSLSERLKEHYEANVPEQADGALYEDTAEILFRTAASLDCYNSEGQCEAVFSSLLSYVLDVYKEEGEEAERHFLITLIRMTRSEPLFSFDAVLDRFFLGEGQELVPADYLLEYYGRRMAEGGDKEAFWKARAKLLETVE